MSKSVRASSLLQRKGSRAHVVCHEVLEVGGEESLAKVVADVSDEDEDQVTENEASLVSSLPQRERREGKGKDGPDVGCHEDVVRRLLELGVDWRLRVVLQTAQSISPQVSLSTFSRTDGGVQKG